jgi:hypothetical protein
MSLTQSLFSGSVWARIWETGMRIYKNGAFELLLGPLQEAMWGRIGGIQIQVPNAVGLTCIGTRVSLAYLTGINDNDTC